MVAQKTRDYELVMILSPEATEDEISATVERVHEYITAHGGVLGEHDVWGLRRLAFPIEKVLEGNYVLTRFSLGPSELSEFKRILKASEDIIRYLVTKV